MQPASGPTDWRDRPLDPRDVLAFIHEFTGQENEAAEVRDFVQLAAACVEEGRSYRDLDATGCAEGFVDWCADQLRAGGFDETEVAGRGK